MILEAKFEASDQIIKADFGNVQNVSDGGYERGYAEGEKVGYNKGYTEGEQKGHESGYADGEQAATAAAEAHNAIILADCNAVLPTKGVEPAETLEQVPDRIEEIETGGENPLDYASSINRMFADTIFPDGTELEVTFGSKATKANPHMLEDVISSTKGLRYFKVNCEAPVNGKYSMQRIANVSLAIEVIDLTGIPQPLTPSNMYRAYYYSQKLKTILGEHDVTGADLSGAFMYLDALETVRFTPGTISKNVSFGQSPNLTDETIQNIIDGLADLTGQTTQTLQFHSDVLEKLTDAQIDTIWAKNWSI